MAKTGELMASVDTRKPVSIVGMMSRLSGKFISELSSEELEIFIRVMNTGNNWFVIYVGERLVEITCSDAIDHEYVSKLGSGKIRFRNIHSNHYVFSD